MARLLRRGPVARAQGRASGPALPAGSRAPGHAVRLGQASGGMGWGASPCPWDPHPGSCFTPRSSVSGWGTFASRNVSSLSPPPRDLCRTSLFPVTPVNSAGAREAAASEGIVAVAVVAWPACPSHAWRGTSRGPGSWGLRGAGQGGPMKSPEGYQEGRLPRALVETLGRPSWAPGMSREAPAHLGL